MCASARLVLSVMHVPHRLFSLPTPAAGSRKAGLTSSKTPKHGRTTSVLSALTLTLRWFDKCCRRDRGTDSNCSSKRPWMTPTDAPHLAFRSRSRRRPSLIRVRYRVHRDTVICAPNRAASDFCDEIHDVGYRCGNKYGQSREQVDKLFWDNNMRQATTQLRPDWRC